ncbi:MAG: SDR family oxidoreductase [Planctomycetota bacterium]|jgi:NADP-dependent 3-hydroxy acid dehydrogenase YdfG
MSVLADKVALVTGASAGIGEATALALARLKARVVLAARRSDRLRALARQIEAEKGRALAVPCDVTDRAQVQRLAGTTLETFGRIDVLINNAGVMPLSPMAKCRIEDWDSTIDVNLKGALYVIGAVLPTMLEQKTGHIVNVGSVAGRKAISTAAVYCGSKFALHAISDALRMELAERAAKDGNAIRVTVVAPGIVTTELRDSIIDQETRQALQPYYDAIKKELSSADIATAIVGALEAPPHVGVNEIVIRPASQIR